MDLTVDKATDGIQRIDVWRALARGCSYPSWHSRSGRFQRVIGRSLHSRLASDETQKKDNQLLYSKPKVLFFILFWERMDTFALLSRQESFSGNVKYSKGGKCDMRPETAQEKEFHNLLPPDLRERSHVTFGYQENLRIIQSHLQKFYGQEQIGHSVLQPILIAKPIGILAIVQNVAKICRPFQQINSMQ